MTDMLYATSVEKEALSLLRTLCSLPAPSLAEERRAEFLLSWIKEKGGKDSYIDQYRNVVWPMGVEGKSDLVVFAAHTDTVFPDLEAYPLREDEENIYAPGVLDDSANLVALLYAALGIEQHMTTSPFGLLVVANSGEEGLGNLYGTKGLFQEFGDRIKCFVTVDGAGFPYVVNRAVGSERYRVSVKTEGGHSYGRFGATNAIHVLSRIICDLYAQKVPEKDGEKTTYNVGRVEGGTSVNTIAESASMLYEFRSTDYECSARMKDSFLGIIDKYKNEGYDISSETIGIRPAGHVASDGMRELERMVDEAILDVAGKEAIHTSGSTDANVPLSLGIPSLCISGAEGGDTHKRSEWMRKDSLPTGIALVLGVMRRILL